MERVAVFEMNTDDSARMLSLIREARASGATKLSFRDFPIERVPTEIGELPHLQELDLSDCDGLTDVQVLSGLRGLRALDLSGCRGLTDVQGLSGLTGLETLDLSWCDGLTDVQVLAGLTGLRELHLSGCRALTDVQVLSGLTGLRELHLSGCHALTDIAPLAGLTKLQTLNLRNCTALTDVGVLVGLTELQLLNLSMCGALTDVGVLAALKGLRDLDLSGCDALTDLTALAGLTGLQQLILIGCDALIDVRGLGGLTGLQRLFLGSHALTDVQGLTGLAGLQILELIGCEVLTDLQGLAGLSGLQMLNLAWCRALTDLQELASLTGLQRLFLRECGALTDLSVFEKLTSLQYLEVLGIGPLECAPAACPLPMSGALEQVFADRLRSAPAELGSKNTSDNALPRIRAWQQDVLAGEAESSTLKLFILGNGAVGKTQICRRLRGETFDPSVPSTHGIQQFQARLFDGDEEMPAVDAHVWDFGGQDVYLGTHALFVDRHAIFVLCWNPAHENTEEFTQHDTLMKNRPLAYWLAYIESLAGEDTPVIVVQTKCDRARDAEHAPAMRTHALKWVQPIACSAKRKDGLKQLLAALENAARGQLEAQGKVRLPQSWVDLGVSLGSRRERLLPRGQFDALCDEHGVNAVPAVVLEYLHRSGRVFWHEWLFNDHIVLDQSWALAGVYAILERDMLMPMIRQQRGRFSPQLLAITAWRGHSEAEREHFLALMLQCQICFKVDDHLYVAPALLPSEAEIGTSIEKEWRGATADAVARLDYIFLHEGVLRAMLCRLGASAGERAVYWAYGACFYDAYYQSVAMLSSSLPDPCSGNGGWIRIEVAGGRADELAEYLVESIVHLSIGRKPEVAWERKPPEVARDVEHMDQDSKTPPFEGLRPGHRPLASGEPVPIYVSYAWDDPTIALVDELERRLPRSLRLLRDKSEVRPGGWISKFMQDIGRARHVVVVLSTKYLQSQYCMRELLYLHDHSLGDRAELMGRIVPVVMEDLRISDGVSRLAHVIHWQERHNKLEAMINQVGTAAAGGAARDELLAMKDFVHRTDELLSWLSDVLMPRVHKGDARPTIQSVIEVLRERTSRRGITFSAEM